MSKFELNFTGSQLSDLLEKFRNSEVLTSEEKAKLQSLGTGEYVTQKQLDEALEEVKVKYEITLAVAATFSNVGFIRPEGTANTGNTSYAHTDYIDISECSSITANVYVKTGSNSIVTWYTADKTYISGETDSVSYANPGTYELTIPPNAVYARFSSYMSNFKPSVTAMSSNKDGGIDVSEEVITKVSKIYLSANGDDSNDGLTSDKPIATFNRAKKLLKAEGELILLEGDYYNFSINLGTFRKITGNGNVRLIYYSDKFTSATPVSGFTKIYSVDCATNITTQIWQHDIPDAKTEILDNEKHPLQRNKTYRLDSTIIRNVTRTDTVSTTLEGFLATMEASDDYMFYYDSSNTKLYFTAPNADFATYPIMHRTKNLITASPNEVHIKRINIMYAQMNLTGLSGIVEDVCVTGAYGGGCFVWDNSRGITLVRCEAAGADNDGINGHGTGQITCIDCWCHDCYDDGESAHEECHIIFKNGLVEYNGSGCTPATGASGEYYNVLVRHNTYTGLSSQGIDALILCNSCLAVNNGIGFNIGGTARGTLINCTAKDNTSDYSLNGTHNKYNCI